MKIKIIESSRGKTPSVYVNKTFEVVQTGKVGDPAPSLRPDPETGKQELTWDSYEGLTTTGRRIRFTVYAKWPTQLFVHRDGFSKGTWVYGFEIEA